MNRGGASHPLVELTLARLREIFREPEALFWAFIFPISCRWRWRSRSRRPGARRCPWASARATGADALRATLAASKSVAPRLVAAADEARALRDGDVDLVIVPARLPRTASIRLAPRAAPRGWCWTTRSSAPPDVRIPGRRSRSTCRCLDRATWTG
jgi:hypothetical protein